MTDTSSSSQKKQTALGMWRDDLCLSLMFLTRLPMGWCDDLSHVPFNRAMRAFPLVGFLLGVAVVIIGLIASFVGLNNFVSATIMVALLVLITGGLHEDGLGDVADGFGATPEAEKKLEIMRDSRLGTYGMLALIFSVLLRIGALASFEDFGTACMAFIGVACLSRFAPFAMIYYMEPARKDGLASTLAKPEDRYFYQGFGLGVALFLLFLPFQDAIVSLVICAAVLYGFMRLCKNQINGHTGDTCGASQQIVEVTALLCLAATL